MLYGLLADVIVTQGAPAGSEASISMLYGFLADVIVTLHLAYVAFVVVGQLAIIAGLVCRWQWVRNFWFRILHLVAIGIVAGETLFAVDCPLTVWEKALRHLAGQPVKGDTFVGRLMHDLLFYDWPTWVFTTIYYSVAAIILLTFVLAPPRWRRKVAPQPVPREFAAEAH